MLDALGPWRRYIIAFIAALVFMCCLMVGVWLWASQQLQRELDIPGNELLYKVPAGASLASVSRDLEQKGIIPSSRLLRIYARLTKQGGIRRGEFLLDSDLNSISLLAKLRSDDVVQYHITLLEGWRYQQALDYLHSKANINAELKGLSWEEQKQKLGIDLDHPEGYFFPDTYRYQDGESDVAILKRAHRKLVSILEREWDKKASGLPYKTPEEALIMASIIEKETAKDSERELIAGVFVRRLQKNMRLQTDPTVIYGMGDRYKGNIRRKDLREATPYNTYVIKGLPPTPIALVAERSIYAAMHPDDSSNLFFVAKGDGSHQFSATLDQHNRAVREYQIENRKSNYRSAP
ncbi:endolytic transglycosylase MltG [Pseudoteredinibacter isoporae]|uniref:Endolytic murein transglycosylase n=1 Tax=Pseudoteredinibacter isoporae TaxID=570281 RepID=A0A7X0MYF3_9GAMM|nr:endolytic transglycosylase MltG [Pseudoteredinibacter isoporae]MBB6521957.1 UPF0755 protein [Pseudoteredinibacter isoporae]NHO87493.1 endolytic transglycosylase MltG [Pseudoteredinibacter isoporae]NIB24176.1 endolytic transglycosylase MltG [Pseudoteredinibacter isoporae]